MNKKFKAIVICCVVISVILAFFMSPIFDLSDISVSGNERVSTDKILMDSGLSDDSNFFSFNEKRAAESLTSLNPYIDKVSFEKIWPNKLNITVTERRISGYVKYINDTYLYIDDNGRVLEVSGMFTEKLPIVVGLNFSKFSLGQPLDVENPSSFNTLVSLSKLFSKYELDELDINTVDVSNPEDIHIYVYHIDVALGDIKDADEKIRTLKGIFQDMPDVKQIRGTLDMKKVAKKYIFKLLT